MSCEPGAQLQLRAALLKQLHRYSAPRPKAGSHAWEEPTLPHDISLCCFVNKMDKFTAVQTYVYESCVRNYKKEPAPSTFAQILTLGDAGR